jgi:hypothetical protein
VALDVPETRRHAYGREKSGTEVEDGNEKHRKSEIPSTALQDFFDYLDG